MGRNGRNVPQQLQIQIVTRNLLKYNMFSTKAFLVAFVALVGAQVVSGAVVRSHRTSVLVLLMNLLQFAYCLRSHWPLARTSDDHCILRPPV